MNQSECTFIHSGFKKKGMNSMSNYCLENETLNNGCICKQLVIRENLETKIIDDIINDFKYITENIEFDENINSSVDSSMKGETPDNAELKEKFDSTVKKAKDLIPVLIDYKSKKNGLRKNEEWLHEYFVMMAPVLKVRKDLIDMIDYNKNLELKKKKRINRRIDNAIDFINHAAQVIDRNIKEIIDYGEINKINSIVCDNDLMIDSYFEDMSILLNRQSMVLIVENKINALINKLILSGYDWAKLITVPDINNETP